MSKIFEYIFYGVGLACMMKAIDIRTFSPEFWYFIVGASLFSLSHDFRYAKIED